MAACRYNCLKQDFISAGKALPGWRIFCYLLFFVVAQITSIFNHIY